MKIYFKKTWKHSKYLPVRQSESFSPVTRLCCRQCCVVVELTGVRPRLAGDTRRGGKLQLGWTGLTPVVASVWSHTRVSQTADTHSSNMDQSDPWYLHHHLTPPPPSCTRTWRRASASISAVSDAGGFWPIRNKGRSGELASFISWDFQYSAVWQS